MSELSPPAVMTVDEAAAYLRIPRSTLYDAIRAGQVPFLRIGRRYRISRVALAASLGEPAEPAGGRPAEEQAPRPDADDQGGSSHAG